MKKYIADFATIFLLLILPVSVFSQEIGLGGGVAVNSMIKSPAHSYSASPAIGYRLDFSYMIEDYFPVPRMMSAYFNGFTPKTDSTRIRLKDNLLNTEYDYNTIVKTKAFELGIAVSYEFTDITTDEFLFFGGYGLGFTKAEFDFGIPEGNTIAEEWRNIPEGNKYIMRSFTFSLHSGAQYHLRYFYPFVYLGLKLNASAEKQNGLSSYSFAQIFINAGLLIPIINHKSYESPDK